MNKTKGIVIAILAIGLGLTACNSGSIRRNPGKTYAPDMTYSRAYDAYTANPNFADGETSRLPVDGTVAQGHELPDHLVEGDTNAYKTFTTNLRFNAAEVEEGGRLFNIYCGICHGTAMDGQGPLYTSGKFAAMPANLKDAKYMAMSVGTMYAAIKYGKNAMGSYASQLDIKQRWMVIAYIKKMQADNGGSPFTLGAAEQTAMAAHEETETTTH
ncbi:MAG: cytochrome c [Chitinophagaceae bacterium]|nr:cytochrome c [Chitinophagaceae bacterium]MCB9045032.1 cytochrome c [Chitinophagales bacterium]